MKTAVFLRTTLAALSLVALSACSNAVRTATPPPAALSVAAPPAAIRLAPFGHAEVDEAASAYASAYAHAVSASLQAGKYLEPLAYRQANAESCLSSRVYRLLGRDITEEEKQVLMKAQVTPAQIQSYLKLAHGYIVRANGMELFSCENAGLKVATGLKY